MRRLSIFVILVLVGAVWYAPRAAAQSSTLDTMRIVNVSGPPGDTIGVVVQIRNQSIAVNSFNLQFRVDTNVLTPVTDLSNDTAYVRYDLLGSLAGFTGLLTQFVIWIPEDRSARGLFVSYDITDSIPRGTSQILRLYFVIKAGATVGSNTTVDLYNDFSSGGIIINFTDPSGLGYVEPTLVDGTVSVSGGPPPGQNHPPEFDPLTTLINANQGSNVHFNVTARDDEGGLLTLLAQSLPTGATFTPTNPVTGTGSATGTFSWTPSQSQSGNFSVTFRATDDSGAVTSQAVTIVVAEVEQDFLFSTSSLEFAVQGGIPGTTGVAVPVDLQTVNDLYGLQFDLAFDQDQMRLDSITPTARLTDFTIYDNIGTLPGKVRVITFGLNNETVGPPTGGTAIMNFWMTIKPTAVAGLYPFKITNAWESISPDPDVPSQELPFDSLGLVAVDQLGDVNLDTRIDVADLVNVVSYIIGTFPLSNRQFRSGNINGDAEVNVVDLVAIISVVFGGLQPAPFVYDGPVAKLSLDLGNISPGSSDYAQINADLPTDIAGVQLEFSYDPKLVDVSGPMLSERSRDLILKYRDDDDGRLVVLMYFKPNEMDKVIRSGLGEILSLPVEAKGEVNGKSPLRLKHVVLASPAGTEIPVEGYQAALPSRYELAQNYPNPFNPRTTIEFTIHARADGYPSDHVEIVIYNLLGQKVRSLVSADYLPGHYAVEWDGTDGRGVRQASGVYFYSLLSGDSRITKKMVLAK